jgi:ABC-type branched-subunit amino acid transport system ATPase component/branched-subunit amino acid ABC-type transport system permease component
MFMSAVALPPEVVALGVVTGLGYGLAAAGLVLTFRQSRVLNLAHGQVGAFGAVVLASLVLRGGWSYWVALPPAILTAAALGGALEFGVVRRLADAPPLVAVVATLAAAQALLRLGLTVGAGLRGNQLFPQPPGPPSFRLGALLVTRADTTLLVIAPCAVAALAAVMRFTRLGWAARAAAANAAGARMLGLRVGRLNASIWALAGALAAVSAVLVLPSSGFATAEALGPGLLLRVLTAAAVARFESIAAALAGGAAVGVVEQAVLWNGGDAGLMAPILFGLVVAAVLARRPVVGRLADPSSWLLVARQDGTPGRMAGRFAVRGPAVVAVAAVVGVVAASAVSPADALTLATVAGLGICAVSAWMVAVLAGQLSVGQVAIAGFGAAVAASVAGSTGSPLAGLLAAPVAGAALGVLVALPALRDRAALLAVLTLALALAGEGALLGASWALGDGRVPARLLSGRGAAALAVAALILAAGGAAALAGSGTGRRMAAARDNERTARAFGLGPAALRLQALGAAGALAGLGGALLVEGLFVATPGTFPAGAGIDVVLAAVVGGLGSPAGALAGTVAVIGLPSFVHFSSAALAALDGGWLLILVACPGGFFAIGRRLGTALRRERRAVRSVPGGWVARGGEIQPAALGGPGIDGPGLGGPGIGGPGVGDPGIGGPGRGQSAPHRVHGSSAAGAAPPGLRAARLSVVYGQVRALDSVDLVLEPGTATAVVGPNGAGKTTLIDALSGAAPVAGGEVSLDGTDLSDLSVEERARLGLARSDQDCVLFPTLTTLDLALLTGAPRDDAVALLAGVGLEPYAHQSLSTLSTGMRRLAELACVLALHPRVLLLDEPSAGLAEAEIEPLAALLERARARQRFSLLLVEHDVTLARRLCERAVLLGDGRVVACGPVAEVLPASGPVASAAR